MEKWLLDEDTSSYPVSWDGLYSLLVDSGDNSTAKFLKLAVTQAIPPQAESSTTQNSKSIYDLCIII